MASFNDLEMAAAVSATGYIQVRKSFFGLLQKAVYEPTQSGVDVCIHDYSTAEGDRLARLLGLPLERMVQEVQANGKPQEAQIGHYRLEACQSSDRQFCALQLFRFCDFKYTPATDMKVYRGSDAETISLIL